MIYLTSNEEDMLALVEKLGCELKHIDQSKSVMKHRYDVVTKFGYRNIGEWDRTSGSGKIDIDLLR